MRLVMGFDEFRELVVFDLRGYTSVPCRSIVEGISDDV